MAKASAPKRPMMKISLPPHAEESTVSAMHPSIAAKGAGGSAKSQHVEMPQKEKKKESPFVFSVDVLTAALTLPVTERTPTRISMHLKEKYKLESEFMIELYTLTKVPPHATINENERIGCLIRNSNFSSSYLEYLVEQNRQLAANLDNSQEAVVALAAEVEKLTKRLACVEEPSGSRATARAVDSPSGSSDKHRKSSKKHRVRTDGTESSSARRKSGKKSSATSASVNSPADVMVTKPAATTSTAASGGSMGGVHVTPVRENSDRAMRGGSGALRSPGPAGRKDESITTVTRTDTPPKRTSDGGVPQDVAPGTTITTITTTTIITKQQTTAPSPVLPSASPSSPRVAKQQRPRKSVPGLNLQQSLKPPAAVQRGSNGGSGLSNGAGSSSPTVSKVPHKSPPSTAHAPERDKVHHPVMLSDRSGGSHHCFDVDGKLGACRNCPARCASFKAQSSGPSWMCGDCGHLNIKHLGSPRNSQP